MLATKTSYPKAKIKILLLENISDAAVHELEAAGYTQIERLGGAISEEELIKAVKGVHLIGIRSKARITKAVLDAADKLIAIGAFCIGVNQIDLRTAAEKGIAVFNAPHANTRSVAELIIGLCVMLIRRIPDKNAAAHDGTWMKDAKGSFELRGKTLGIIGYGNIGSQVSIMAEAMGMHVIYHDIATKLPHGNAKPIRDLKEMLRQSDIVTLHVPSDATTHNMINAETLKAMKKGSILLNYARGDVVDLPALKKALLSGKLIGAAVDVFPEEPEKNGDHFDCILQNLSNVILTPHIGGSTEEAQSNIGLDVTAKLIKYLDLGTSEGSHTVPPVNLPPQSGTHRILHIHRNIPGVLGEINSRLSAHGINIVGQYLNTSPEIGYVILDVESKLSKEAFELLKDVQGTVRVRMVY
ncbi:MAG: phosphoglycerate dehydrogenase [Blastocatellia bacterium]|nr:phosphoglycerate dehydrogenase [Chloracidobacterium sp.]MBL8185161.1 phosphoglycerate dehydrogenase [Blastocatellia bacterium]HBE82020.1 phosphoglycerate dehydrogenase [Blastocatellia bacterium]HRJ90190.1 phosphoglycerate dehydrogenase [Pyrinomonadaceae bacterium]HRK49046.1 phosphoglycerate dehydrogenase [Pyrinomonadaceae bacterium]